MNLADKHFSVFIGEAIKMAYPYLTYVPYIATYRYFCVTIDIGG
jgi:hypothetical protein